MIKTLVDVADFIKSRDPWDHRPMPWYLRDSISRVFLELSRGEGADEFVWMEIDRLIRRADEIAGGEE